LRRSVLHRTNDRFLAGVLGLIHDEHGRLLVLEHRYRTPWAWGLPGGYIHHDESLPDALHREIREEVGIEIEIDASPFDTELNIAQRMVAVTFIARRVESTADLRLSSEILRGGFYGEDELPEGIYPYHASLIRRCFQVSGRLQGPRKAT
jgi:8-oxo-dGTP pyrophosphatase MutT (NUDIX family)